MMNNPMALIKARAQQMVRSMYKVPNNIQDPQEIVQYLLNTKQTTQDKVNESSMQARNNPNFKQYFQNKG